MYIYTYSYIERDVERERQMWEESAVLYSEGLERGWDREREREREGQGEGR